MGTHLFGYFALIISSDESQSKAQFNLFNLQSVGENTTGYCAKYIKFVSTDENLKKRLRLFLYCFLYPLENVLLYKALLIRYQLVITSMLCCC